MSDPYPGGDNDGIVEPGETVRIAQPLTGAALTDETGITGTLTAVSGGGTVVDGSATWPTLGQARSASQHLRLEREAAEHVRRGRQDEPDGDRAGRRRRHRDDAGVGRDRRGLRDARRDPGHADGDVAAISV